MPSQGRSPRFGPAELSRDQPVARIDITAAVMDALPYNEMGKLLRREVRKLFASTGE